MHALIRTLHLALAGVLVIAAISVSVSAGSTMYKGYETPDFTISAADGPFELRRYEPHLVAEVHVDGERGAAIRRGFRTLAGFIFGKNAEETKIAMTAPVAQAPAEGVWQVQFMMPDGYDLDTLPTPDDERIRFRMTDAETQAVMQFSGWWNDRKLTEKADELRRWTEARGLQIADGPRFYFYDDPFTLPMRRRNEVAFQIQ
ncbi:MAG: heme-binding protein [Rhodobacteraceae bacterium]|nr:heme-binding protein [Paracoccaceae bacterium]